jgi:hypothetical protein
MFWCGFLKGSKRREEMIMPEINAVSAALYWFISLGLAYLVFFVISKYLIRKEVSQVVERFKRTHSLCAENPKAAGELGLGPSRALERATKTRDSNPYALEFMIHKGVIRVTDEGKLCLLKDKVNDFLQ